MRGGLAGSRRTAVLAGVVCVVAVGGASLALAAGSSPTITACAVKRTGALRLLSRGRHCRRSERAVRWNQTGPRGPRGLTGPRGPQGAAGTVDTSNFYTKSQADGRYLGLHGTADNAGQLGGKPPSSYVTSNAFGGRMGLRFTSIDVAAGGSGELYPALPLGTLQATCSDPATSGTIQYTFEGTSGHVQRFHGGTTTYGTTDSPLSLGGADHVEYLIDYSDGSVAQLQVWSVMGPDGANLCRFRVMATTYNP